ncbi:MAG: hypothetical protein KIT31_41650, partial [Deltaproteobacteria bacterium]|nr:hypothetical protein [Deltaproteobacteria bacterium]
MKKLLGVELVDLGDLALDEGAHLLLERALRRGAEIHVAGTAATLPVDLPAWCRARGHRVAPPPAGFAIRR